MEKRLEKNFEIFLEGIDKTGKDSLARYVDNYSGFSLCVHSRGMLSTIAYNKLYKREVDYNFFEPDYKPLYVLLTVDKKDWEVRCKLNNEPAISYEDNVAAFEYAADIIRRNGYKVIEFNTSQYTPHAIATAIVGYVETQNDVKLLEDK